MKEIQSRKACDRAETKVGLRAGSRRQRRRTEEARNEGREPNLNGDSSGCWVNEVRTSSRGHGAGRADQIEFAA